MPCHPSCYRGKPFDFFRQWRLSVRCTMRFHRFPRRIQPLPSSLLRRSDHIRCKPMIRRQRSCNRLRERRKQRIIHESLRRNQFKNRRRNVHVTADSITRKNTLVDVRMEHHERSAKLFAKRHILSWNQAHIHRNWKRSMIARDNHKTFRKCLANGEDKPLNRTILVPRSTKDLLR